MSFLWERWQTILAAGDAMDSILGLLRTQLAPALKACKVDNVEIAYVIVDTVTVQGTQFRGTTGLRVPRFEIPERLTNQLEDWAIGFLQASALGAGDGVLTVALTDRRVVRRHRSDDDCQTPSNAEWRL